MADAPDPKVASAYRELGAEEPPPTLDQAILAAARRPRAASRPWTQRYAAPLGLAAVLVLSVTVTLRMQHEQPGIESIARQDPAAKAAAMPSAPAAAPEAALKLKPELQIRQPEAARDRATAGKERGEPKPFPAQAPPPASADRLASRADAARSADSNIRGMAERQAEERTARDAEAATRAPQFGALQAKRQSDQSAPALAAAAPAAKPAAEQPAKAAGQAQVAGAVSRAASAPADTPEREFERIAQLRAEGRHDEADQAFLEFRRRYPDFRLTEEMLKRVLRR